MRVIKCEVCNAHISRLIKMRPYCFPDIYRHNSRFPSKSGTHSITARDDSPIICIPLSPALRSILMHSATFSTASTRGGSAVIKHALNNFQSVESFSNTCYIKTDILVYFLKTYQLNTTTS